MLNKNTNMLKKNTNMSSKRMKISELKKISKLVNKKGQNDENFQDDDNMLLKSNNKRVYSEPLGNNGFKFQPPRPTPLQSVANNSQRIDYKLARDNQRLKRVPKVPEEEDEGKRIPRVSAVERKQRAFVLAQQPYQDQEEVGEKRNTYEQRVEQPLTNRRRVHAAEENQGFPFYDPAMHKNEAQWGAPKKNFVFQGNYIADIQNSSELKEESKEPSENQGFPFKTPSCLLRRIWRTSLRRCRSRRDWILILKFKIIKKAPRIP